MVEMTVEQFELCVRRALDLIPDEIGRRMVNVAVLVEDQPAAGGPQNLLGQYQGTPVTNRWGYGGIGALPDRIFIYREPILRICQTVAEVVDQVVTTIIHEVAHYFGLSERRIHELGWG